MKALLIKSRIIAIIMAVAGSCVFHACDKVEPPFEENPAIIDTGGIDSTIIYQRKVLVEDFTGHVCGNCPQAAIALQGIMDRKGEKIVPLAIHAGYFALPETDYPEDFRCNEGNDLDNFFGNSAAGNPNGMVNRRGYASLTHIKFHSNWEGVIDSLLLLPADAHIEITTTYDAANRKLNADVKTKFLNNLTIASSAKFKLAVYLSEDSIIASQKDYSQTPEHISNYVFRHVLRGSMNSTWGEELAGDAIIKDSEFIKTYSNYVLNQNWNDKHLYIIAFVYRSDTYEVIQAEEKRIK